MCITRPQNLNLAADTSVNMENSHKESLLSAVEDFSPPPSPNPVDFSDSNKDEREEEQPLGFGVRPYTFELLSTADSAAELEHRHREREREGEREGEGESQLIPTTCGPVRWLTTDSILRWREGRAWGGYSRKNFI